MRHVSDALSKYHFSLSRIGSHSATKISECWNQERLFKEVNQSTKTTNFDNDHLMIDALLCSAVKILQRKLAKTFGNQERTISKEWKGVHSRHATVITERMIDEDPQNSPSTRSKSVISCLMVTGILYWRMIVWCLRMVIRHLQLCHETHAFLVQNEKLH